MINFYKFEQILEQTKNAPHGKRNAVCSRCGNKEKAKLYDINAGKAKCRNCGGYLNLETNESIVQESRKEKIKCPYPKNKEYCKEYNRFLNGEINTPPKIEDFERKNPALGHWDGPRGGNAPTRREVIKRKAKRGEGKYKNSWKKEQ